MMEGLTAVIFCFFVALSYSRGNYVPSYIQKSVFAVKKCNENLSNRNYLPLELITLSSSYM